VPKLFENRRWYKLQQHRRRVIRRAQRLLLGLPLNPTLTLEERIELRTKLRLAQARAILRLDRA
jgi:hypothetical protein